MIFYLHCNYNEYIYFIIVVYLTSFCVSYTRTS
jgi:hypothetical protein